MSETGFAHEDQFEWVNDTDGSVAVEIAPWHMRIEVEPGEALLVHGSSSRPGELHWNEIEKVVSAWEGAMVSAYVNGWIVFESQAPVPSIAAGDIKTDFYGSFGFGKPHE